MAERITIARPYAKAIFAQARAGKRLEAWSAVLQLGAAISADPRVKGLFGNPHVSPEQLAGLYTDIGGDQLDSDARNLLATLAANRRLGYLPEIARSYEQFRAEHERVIDVTVTSAVELSPQQRERLTAALRKRLDREVRLHTELNPALLGGAVLRAGDLVIDGSITSGLAQLAAQVAG
jgi:F-type H+-transporting ATPase subunit delta